MKDINHAFFTGRVSRDPELRATASGTSVLGFGVAIGDTRKNNKTGEWDEYAHFVDVKIFGRMADTLSKMLAKGMRVTVAGKLNFSQWEKDGSKRTKLEIVADDVILPPKQNGGVESNTASRNVYKPNDQVNTVDIGGMEFTEVTGASIYDDELPF